MPDFFNLKISLIPSGKKDLYVKGLKKKKTQRKEWQIGLSYSLKFSAAFPGQHLTTTLSK